LVFGASFREPAGPLNFFRGLGLRLLARPLSVLRSLPPPRRLSALRLRLRLLTGFLLRLFLFGDGLRARFDGGDLPRPPFRSLDLLRGGDLRLGLLLRAGDFLRGGEDFRLVGDFLRVVNRFGLFFFGIRKRRPDSVFTTTFRFGLRFRLSELFFRFPSRVFFNWNPRRSFFRSEFLFRFDDRLRLRFLCGAGDRLNSRFLVGEGLRRFFGGDFFRTDFFGDGETLNFLAFGSGLGLFSLSGDFESLRFFSFSVRSGTSSFRFF